MFDDTYVEFENATEKCEGLGARLPVLDSAETIKIVKRYLETSNFTVFEVSDNMRRICHANFRSLSVLFEVCAQKLNFCA